MDLETAKTPLSLENSKNISVTLTGGEPSSPQTEFMPGAPVIYGLLGRCNVEAVETRTIGGSNLRFYKLQIHKVLAIKTAKKEAAIWLPVEAAAKKGLRALMTEDQAKEALKLLGNKEHFFSLEEPWPQMHKKLEEIVHTGGPLGLTQVVAYLHVLKKFLHHPSSEMIDLSDRAYKVLVREIAEVLKQTIRVTEEQIEKLLKNKPVTEN